MEGRRVKNVAWIHLGLWRRLLYVARLHPMTVRHQRLPQGLQPPVKRLWQKVSTIQHLRKWKSQWFTDLEERRSFCLHLAGAMSLPQLPKNFQFPRMSNICFKNPPRSPMLISIVSSTRWIRANWDSPRAASTRHFETGGQSMTFWMTWTRTTSTLCASWNHWMWFGMMAFGAPCPTGGCGRWSIAPWPFLTSLCLFACGSGNLTLSFERKARAPMMEWLCWSCNALGHRPHALPRLQQQFDSFGSKMLNVQARVQIQRQEMQQSAQSARKNVSASPNLTCHCGCKVGDISARKGFPFVGLWSLCKIVLSTLVPTLHAQCQKWLYLLVLKYILWMQKAWSDTAYYVTKL